MSPERGLSDPARVLLLLLFGAVSLLVIRLASAAPVSRPDLLLLATSSAAIVTALAWLTLLALRSGRAWALAMGVGIWIPYLNLVLASAFARRHWRRGARVPALLGIAGLIGQTLASVRLLFPLPPPLV